MNSWYIFGAKFNFYNYWTSKSHYVSEITLDIWEQKILLMEKPTIGAFWGQVQSFSDRRTLKFLKMQCKGTNKKCGLCQDKKFKSAKMFQFSLDVSH